MNNHRFTFLCTKDERSSLTKLAAFYCRSQSDTIRMLIRNAVKGLPQTHNVKGENISERNHEEAGAE